MLKATTSNRLGSGVAISNRETNGNPQYRRLRRSELRPWNKGHIADPNAVDVAYVGSRELVIHWGSGGAQKVGNAFNLLIFSS